MIHFFSADRRIVLLQRRAHRMWLESIAADRDYKIDYLAYIFCSDDYLLEMNKQFLDHDYYTDIITFPLASDGKIINAECYLSIDRIRDNAKANGFTFANELRRVMAHGLLHLIGEDDKSVESEARMRKAEEIALSRWLFHVERKDHKTNQVPRGT